MIRCLVCYGSGYVKQIPVVCKICKGKTCILCKSTGLSKQPFETCYQCDGDGEIEKSCEEKRCKEKHLKYKS